MKAFTGACCLAAAVLYGSYAIPALAFSVRTMTAIEQCHQDFVLALKTNARIGRMSEVSAACATTESAAIVGKALLN